MMARAFNLSVCAVIFLMGAVGVGFRVVGGLLSGAFDTLLENGDDYDSY